MNRSTKITVMFPALGVLILFSAFLVYQLPPVTIAGTLKVSDLLVIVGGLLFIMPIYRDSVRRKTAHHAPNRTVWATLPVVGIVLAVVGVLVPNAVMVVSFLSLADLCYLLAALLMLPVFAYPMGEGRYDLFEVEEGIDPDGDDDD